MARARTEKREPSAATASQAPPPASQPRDRRPLAIFVFALALAVVAVYLAPSRHAVSSPSLPDSVAEGLTPHQGAAKDSKSRSAGSPAASTAETDASAAPPPHTDTSTPSPRTATITDNDDPHVDSSGTKDARTQSQSQSESDAAMPGGTAPDSDSSLRYSEGCGQELARAATALRLGRGATAGVTMVSCANARPTDDVAQAAAALLLLRLGEHEAALHYAEAAATLASANPARHEALAAVATSAGARELAVQAGERALELRLGLEPGSWRVTLFSAADAPAEDQAWAADAGPEVRAAMRALLAAYQTARWLPAANALFKIESKLRPADAEFQRLFADFSIGIGLVEQGITASLRSLQTQHELMYPDDDAYGAVMRSGLLLLGAGLDGHTVLMARNLLAAEDLAELHIIGDNCGLNITRYFSVDTISAWDARALLDACIVDSGIVAALVELGADTGPLANGFGFTVAHTAAAAGMVGLWQELLGAHVDLLATNNLGQTAAHAAVMRGSYDVLKSLADRGAPLTTPDRFGRTPFHLACMHQWHSDQLFELLGTPRSRCEARFKTPLSLPPLSPGAVLGGDWRIKRSDARMRLVAGIDEVDGLSAESFLLDYLAVQRPVLVRNALRGAAWQSVLPRWSRETLLRDFGDLEVSAGSIPYAHNFGFASNVTTLSDFVDMMDDLFEAHVDDIEDPNPPPYVFDSVLQSNSPLLAIMPEPALVDARVTEIVTRTMQFYLGPAGSGAPMHFHRGAWNALVHGRKRWFLLPPPLATYSTQHPREFLDEVYPGLKQAGVVLECMQESGDVVFVPEGWGHAVLNVAESIGFASEFEWGGSEFAIDPPETDSDEAGDGENSMEHEHEENSDVNEDHATDPDEELVFRMGKI